MSVHCILSLGTRQPPRIPQRAKGFALRGFLPLLGASTPGFAPAGYFSPGLCPLGLPHFAVCTWGLLPIVLRPQAMPSLGWKPLSFYQLALDHPGDGKTWTALEGFCHTLGEVTSGDYVPWGHPQLTPPQSLLRAVLSIHGAPGPSPACLLPRAQSLVLPFPGSLPPGLTLQCLAHTGFRNPMLRTRWT
jgi:hypothetical protein